jgi:hypothetical protein
MKRWRLRLRKLRLSLSMGAGAGAWDQKVFGGHLKESPK